MLIIYLSGCLAVIVIGYLYNRHGNFWMQLEFGQVLILAFLSWIGVLTQIIVGISQIRLSWFLPKEKDWRE